jgi:signal transduction histidine kinase
LTRHCRRRHHESAQRAAPALARETAIETRTRVGDALPRIDPAPDRVGEPQSAAPADAVALPGAPPRVGLSGKLLFLTILFVLVSEVLIYVPSIANYRLNWFADKLAVARTAALVLDAAPSGMVSDDLARKLLDSIGAKAVAMKTGDTRRLLVAGDMPTEVHQHVDIREMQPLAAIRDAFEVLLGERGHVLRVVGSAPMGGEFMEIVIDEEPLRQAMLAFSRNILILSLLISAITATLVYLALNRTFVRPMRQLTARMMAFRADPENPARIQPPSDRGDEIGMAERELAVLQRDLSGMLQQKARLAALGLAVSKINHDLRNLLTSAQLFSDRLAAVPDPRVQRLAPKLTQTIERAVAFTESTLAYGRVHERPPERRMIALDQVVEDVRELTGVEGGGAIRWIASIERGMKIDADPEHLLRILSNLARNARQALEARAPNDPDRDQIRITGRREGTVAVIEVADTGPGVPVRAREHLFEAFQGSTRPGGSGLGLAIAAELVRAHGGDIRLIDGTLGATFRVAIPDRPVDIAAARESRHKT